MADKVKKPKKAKKDKTKKGKLDQKGKRIESEASYSSESSKGGGVIFSIISLLSALIIIAVVLFGSLFILIKMNVMGVADTYKDSIAKVPLLNLALPVEEEAEEVTFETLQRDVNALRKENDSLKQREELSLAELERLRKFEDEYEARMMVTDERTRSLEQQVATMEAEKRRTDEARYEIERMVAEGDKDGFAEYFEMVEPSVARDIYSQIMQEKKASDEANEFIKLYEGIEAKTTAEIFEEMGLSRLDLVVECLRGMKRDIASEIISEMSVEYAAAVTLRLAGDLP